jgi:hypothetical protein
MKINNRLEALERHTDNQTRSLSDVKLSDDERSFIDDLHNRRIKAGTNFYHEVCNPEEFERIKRLSTKMGIVYYNQLRQKDENQ